MAVLSFLFLLVERKEKSECLPNKKELGEFAFVPIGGGWEIRTPVPLRANGFQDRRVMTTSLTLRI